MEPADGQDARARRGSPHWRPHHSWNCHHRGTGARSASAPTWPPLTRLHQLEPTSPRGSSNRGTTDAFRRSTWHWKTDCRPMGLGSKGPGTTHAGTEHSPGMLPFHQPRPHQPATPYQQAAQPQSQPAAPHEQLVQQSNQPATPYQQAVQLPKRPAGRGLLARPPSDRVAPTPNQAIPECGRQQTRGRGIRGRSASHPGWGQGMTTNAPSTTTQGNGQSQPSHHFWPGRLSLAEMAAKYHSSGW